MLHPASNRKTLLTHRPTSKFHKYRESISYYGAVQLLVHPGLTRLKKNVGVLLSAPTTSRPILFTFLHGTKGCAIPSGLTTPNQKNGANDVVRELNAAICR